MTDADSIQRFVFNAYPVRGQIVHLDRTWGAVLERHDYPDAVRGVLGQALAATVLMASTLKFDGRMTLQLQGDGPLRLLVVQCTHDMRVRGLARWDDNVPNGTFREQVGDGRLVITIETDNRRQPYQGVVPLTGETLSECLTAYFETSEQLSTRIWVAADATRCAGLLLQRLPEEADEDPDAWQRIQLLAATVSQSDELIELSHRELLRRLFHEDDLRLHEAAEVQFECSCSSGRVESVLLSLGEDELQSILDEEGEIGVVCEFCNKSRRFDSVDVARLLSGAAPNDSPTIH
ncbi:MAG: Hsp33 family molecular chaperone HslO [Gammaproteobacteria bacterium]|nr:Hsp33 family molecular chaperone HslO [Gammaproteobacteria bacterium]NND58822.1 Hsp33 family molecular chaperone HslO [Gammaproteobacteria bacterium]